VLGQALRRAAPRAGRLAANAAAMAAAPHLAARAQPPGGAGGRGRHHAALGQRQSPYAVRAPAGGLLRLPAYPTTTIGSFPQTAEIRRARSDFKAGRMDAAGLPGRHAGRDRPQRARARSPGPGRAGARRGRAQRHGRILRRAARRLCLQPVRLGAVLWLALRQAADPVWRHQPPEGHDRGVDCLRPVADGQAHEGHAHRPGHHPELVLRARRPAASASCKQLALAIREEVLDLEKAGVRVIQIDEAALREGLPLRRAQWHNYLDWAVEILPHQRQRRARRAPRSTPTCAIRSSTTSCRHRRHGCRRDHHRDLALGHGAARRVRALPLPQRDRPRRVRHPLAQHPDAGAHRAADAKGRRAHSGRAPVGQPGLRPQDPPVGRGTPPCCAAARCRWCPPARWCRATSCCWRRATRFRPTCA
jgi:hypothetical protein